MSVSDEAKGLFDKVFDNFKKITPALVAITILTGLILFLPESILQKMNLSQIPAIWRTIIGLAFLLGIALTVTIVLFEAFSQLSIRRKNRKLRENLKKKLKTLSPQQKNIVVELLKSKDKMIQLNSNSGDTLYLVNCGFIICPQQIITFGLGNDIIKKYAPQPWLLDLFNEEPELF